MVLPQAMAWVQYWFRVLSLKFCGKSKKICGDISQVSPAFCMYGVGHVTFLDQNSLIRPFVGHMTFWTKEAQSEPCVGHVTFWIKAGQSGPCIGHVTFLDQSSLIQSLRWTRDTFEAKEVNRGPALATWYFRIKAGQLSMAAKLGNMTFLGHLGLSPIGPSGSNAQVPRKPPKLLFK